MVVLVLVLVGCWMFWFFVRMLVLLLVFGWMLDGWSSLGLGSWFVLDVGFGSFL